MALLKRANILAFCTFLKVQRMQSRDNLNRFVAEAETARQQIGQVPDDVNISGHGMANLESNAPVDAVQDLREAREIVARLPSEPNADAEEG